MSIVKLFPAAAGRAGIALVLVAGAMRADAQASSAPRRLTLDEAVAIAQHRSLTMLAARQELDIAMWTDRAFNSRLRPSVSLSGSAFAFEHGINRILQNDGSTRYLGQSNNQSLLSLGISQPLLTTGGTMSISSGLSRTDEFGTRSSQSWQSTPLVVGINQPIFKPRELLWQQREEDATAELARSKFLEAREDVAIAAADAFFGLYMADIALRNAAANAAISDTVLRVNRERYESAAIGQMELNRSELVALRARIALDDAHVARQHAEATLARTLNISGRDGIELVPPDEIPELSVDPDAAINAALRNGSDADQIALDSVTASRELASAQLSSGFSASLQAFAGFNQTAANLGPAYRSPLGRQSVSLGIQLPVMDWGAGHADTEAAMINRAHVSTLGRAVRAKVAEDARFAAVDAMQSIRALRLAAQADTLAAIQFAIARAQYSVGNITLTEFLLAQQDKDNGIIAHAQALRTFWAQYYALRRITLFDFVHGKALDR